MLGHELENSLGLFVLLRSDFLKVFMYALSIAQLAHTKCCPYTGAVIMHHVPTLPVYLTNYHPACPQPQPPSPAYCTPALASQHALSLFPVLSAGNPYPY